MLNKKEKQVMTFLYKKGKGKESVLISPQEISNDLMPKFEINNIEVDQIMKALVLDNYIDVIYSDNKGKPLYVVSLKQRGASFERENQHKRKVIYMYVFRTIALAILSTAVGLLLKNLFS